MRTQAELIAEKVLQNRRRNEMTDLLDKKLDNSGLAKKDHSYRQPYFSTTRF
jgi:hypothetical protein